MIGCGLLYYRSHYRVVLRFPLDKPLVSHLARKTFACTIGLANGMNIGVLSKLLGHSSIQITLDSYATVIDELMISNVRALKEKLSNDEKRADNTHVPYGD